MPLIKRDLPTFAFQRGPSVLKKSVQLNLKRNYVEFIIHRVCPFGVKRMRFHKTFKVSTITTWDITNTRLKAFGLKLELKNLHIVREV